MPEATSSSSASRDAFAAPPFAAGSGLVSRARAGPARKGAGRPGRRRGGPPGPLARQRVQHRRLEPAEAEVETLLVQERARQADGLRVAGRRLALDRRAAGEAEAEQGRHLVERLAGGVVERRAEQPKVERAAAGE